MTALCTAVGLLYVCLDVTGIGWPAVMWLQAFLSVCVLLVYLWLQHSPKEGLWERAIPGLDRQDHLG